MERYGFNVASTGDLQAASRLVDVGGADRLHAPRGPVRCGLTPVELGISRTAGLLQIEHMIQGCHGVAVLPSVRRPEVIGLLGSDIAMLAGLDP